VTTVDRFRRWYRYEREAHAMMLASLDTVPGSARLALEYLQAVDLIAHLAMARRLWLFRLGASAEGPADLFPRGMTLPRAQALLADTEQAWTAYLDGLDDAALARKFTYRSLEGPKFRNVVEDILTQLFGHSSYHRGQIAQLVRRLGGTPAETDFVFWSREPSSG
jgi:uncharacterized damage-inducible protein DinB